MLLGQPRTLGLGGWPKRIFMGVVGSVNYRLLRTQGFQVWQDVVCA